MSKSKFGKGSVKILITLLLYFKVTFTVFPKSSIPYDTGLYFLKSELI